MNWSAYSTLRRRHLRRAARDRRPRRVLPRVDVPRALDLRLGPAEAEGAPRDDLARGDRDDRVRVLHPRRQLVDAAPGRLQAQSRQQPCRDDLDRADPDELDPDPRLRSYDRGRRADRVDARPRGRGMARAPRRARASLRAGAADRALGDARLRGGDGADRPRAGAVDDEAAADEDGRRRGALHDRQRRHVLALRHRPLGQAPDEVARLDRRPARPLDPRQQLVGRARCRASTTCRRSTRRGTGRATTGRSSASTTGASGSWPGSASSPCSCSALGLWLARVPGRLERNPRFLRAAVWALAIPFVANLSGWLFTEIGRQPWVVQGLLLTRDAVSPTVGPWSVGLTLAGFTLLYGALAVVEGMLMTRAARPARGSRLGSRLPPTLSPPRCRC